MKFSLCFGLYATYLKDGARKILFVNLHFCKDVQIFNVRNKLKIGIRLAQLPLANGYTYISLTDVNYIVPLFIRLLGAAM